MFTFTPNGTVTSETWPMIMHAEPDEELGYKLWLVTSAYNGSDQSYIYGLDIRMDTRWTALSTTDDRVELQDTSTIPIQHVAIGKSVANPCTSTGAGGTPSAFYLTRDAGSGTGKPTATKITDNWDPSASATGYAIRPASADADDLSSTSIFAYKVEYPSTSFIYYLSENGKFYAVSPTTGALPTGWPKSLSLTIPRQDLSMDLYGGVVFFTSAGDVKCYWGKF